MAEKRLDVPLLTAAAAMQAGCFAMLALDDLALRVVEYVSVYLFLSVFYLYACRRILTRPLNVTSRRSLIALVWLPAVAFRLTLLPLDPSLSEDLERYRWNGMAQHAGANPYSAVPEDPRWEGLRDAAWEKVPRKDLPSVYGPLYEWVYRVWFAAAAAVEDAPERQARLFRIPFALADLGVGWALTRLLTVVGLPASRALIYLWCPLTFTEFWAQGHNDSLAVWFVLLGLTAAERAQPTRALLWTTLAAAAKIWPIVLAPFVLRRALRGRLGEVWRPLVASGAVAAVLVWPYWPEIAGIGEVLRGFLGGWRNNDSLFGLFLDYFNEDFDEARWWSTRALGLCLIGLFAARRALIPSALAAIVLILAFSANCFPWYLTWFAPLLALRPVPGLLLWTSLVVLEYQVLIEYRALGVWRDSDLFRALEYFPVLGMLLFSTAWNRLRRRPRGDLGARDASDGAPRGSETS